MDTGAQRREEMRAVRGGDITAEHSTRARRAGVLKGTSQPHTHSAPLNVRLLRAAPTFSFSSCACVMSSSTWSSVAARRKA